MVFNFAKTEVETAYRDVTESFERLRAIGKALHVCRQRMIESNRAFADHQCLLGECEHLQSEWKLAVLKFRCLQGKHSRLLKRAVFRGLASTP